MIIYTNYYESRPPLRWNIMVFHIVTITLVLLQIYISLYIYLLSYFFGFFAWTPISGSLLFMLWSPLGPYCVGCLVRNPTNGKQKIVYENENMRVDGWWWLRGGRMDVVGWGRAGLMWSGSGVGVAGMKGGSAAERAEQSDHTANVFGYRLFEREAPPRHKLTAERVWKSLVRLSHL